VSPRDETRVRQRIEKRDHVLDLGLRQRGGVSRLPVERRLVVDVGPILRGEVVVELDAAFPRPEVPLLGKEIAFAGPVVLLERRAAPG
jgi:hypothetical protein